MSNLYDYMADRLLVANNQNDESILDEVSGLMIELIMGWDAMPDVYKQLSYR
jgi:flagellin-specific chaperone FliS